MADINCNSDTWREVAAWAAKHRQDAVDQLIAGSSRDDHLRGQIESMDELLGLVSDPQPGIPQPSY
ncbi:hypothetical protein ACUN9Y_13240 [Halomonas sp. V046]|uniref:hypothetical protein n=1 Tax=Halomonas sp. V046 TaxID=3459611 RepID=UPI0040444048